MNKLVNYLPGFLLAVGVAIISKIIALWVPSLGAATIAILLGIALGNTFFKQESLNNGTKLAESRLLEISVVLLGANVTFQTIAKLGLNGLGFILVQMTITIFAAYLIGRKMAFSENMALLMAGGNAVCGSSAIASIAPVIEAKEEEKGQTITLVNLMGTVLMLSLPPLALFLYGTQLIAKSALIGGTLQSVGQVVASASMVSPETVQFATLFKIMRIIMLIVVVFAFSRFKMSQGSLTQQQTKRTSLPWYIIGFFIFCCLNSFFNLPAFIQTSAHTISTWFEITALAAIGLRLDFQKFLKEGRRFLLYGLAVLVVQVGSAILLIFLFNL